MILIMNYYSCQSNAVTVSFWIFLRLTSHLCQCLFFQYRVIRKSKPRLEGKLVISINRVKCARIETSVKYTHNHRMILIFLVITAVSQTMPINAGDQTTQKQIRNEKKHKEWTAINTAALLLSKNSCSRVSNVNILRNHNKWLSTSSCQLLL